MRIVAGKHRARRLRAPKGHDIRPTSDRVREVLFNLLAHSLDWNGLEDAHVADIFCGTGAVALEALSRGAAHAILVDDSSSAHAAARENIAALGEEKRTTLLRNDATRPMPRPGRPVDLVYMDPPYRLEVAADVLINLQAGGWFAPEALAVVELHRQAAFEAPEGFETIDDRHYGDTRLVSLRYGGS
ncbi:MAG: 16S rRNA (guanine(966)-N(2))-methyltransferase RsmD [Rhodospirillaceae bacterium]|jgi:16S rRNA (guanine966-N2)-methyltransferase|nr:16S rRNA (guanine(966)-N(2))-methyltransferase RsmD [Rhodospirillaceae bacterium]MBT6510004.1 16S rRNA (guanine(966)-N(2))-methyltransferase RsmD [Rhodospirillaceae bacterium]MBT7613153.1 16S rRNA (guanine(966)-N(2))-methyltransferase RsmD [Rhodospirillaceae bacterium]MBT7648440.1 16S rRNA (guanine(966)-N(2))-methyltransferase RsmD [Rhodospirillaceae bacterium]